MLFTAQLFKPQQDCEKDGVSRNNKINNISDPSALWNKFTDPAFRQNLATQCGHALPTVTRYYEFSEKVEPGKAVVYTLKKMRSHCGNEDDHTAQDSAPGVEDENAYVCHTWYAL